MVVVVALVVVVVVVVVVAVIFFFIFVFDFVVLVIFLHYIATVFSETSARDEEEMSLRLKTCKNCILLKTTVASSFCQRPQ